MPEHTGSFTRPYNPPIVGWRDGTNYGPDLHSKAVHDPGKT